MLKISFASFILVQYITISWLNLTQNFGSVKEPVHAVKSYCAVVKADCATNSDLRCGAWGTPFVDEELTLFFFTETRLFCSNTRNKLWNFITPKIYIWNFIGNIITVAQSWNGGARKSNFLGHIEIIDTRRSKSLKYLPFFLQETIK